jgi:hypothetical protein
MVPLVSDWYMRLLMYAAYCHPAVGNKPLPIALVVVSLCEAESMISPYQSALVTEPCNPGL